MEILRATSDIAPLLFGLLERRIDGIAVNNMYVICSSNYGNSYITNFDFSDSALRRRQIFIEYQPNLEDILEFAEKSNYNEVLKDVLSLMNISEIISHDKTVKELEQDTQLGSWSLLNSRWESKKIKDYKKAREDMGEFGEYFFSGVTKNIVMNKLTILNELSEIDIHNEIIIKNGLAPSNVIYNKKGKIFDKENKETELKIRTKAFIINEFLNKKISYIRDNFNNILNVFQNDTLLLISLIKEIKEIEKKVKNKKDVSKYNEEFNKILDLVIDGLNSSDEEFKNKCKKIYSYVMIKEN